MTTVQLVIEEISHGRGLSFKKGIASILIDTDFSKFLPDGHERSYKDGQKVGLELKDKISKLVKD